jgi:hypothetical protein
MNDLLLKIEKTSGSGDQALHKSTPATSLTGYQKIRARIDENVTRLFRLSGQTRRNRKTEENAQAAIYDPKDVDGQRLADGYKRHLEWRLNSSKQKMPDGFLKHRIRDTMMARWRRTSYYSTPKPLALVEAAAKDLVGQSVVDVRQSGRLAPATDEQATTDQATKGLLRSRGSASTRPRSTGSTGSASSRLDELPRSLVSWKNMSSLDGMEDADFPEPPDPSLDSGEFTCPFCGDLQPHSMREQGPWR